MTLRSRRTRPSLPEAAPEHPPASEAAAARPTPETRKLARWVRQAVQDTERALQAPGQAVPLLHAVNVQVRPADAGLEVHLRFAVSYGVSIPTVTRMIHRRIAEQAGTDNVRVFFDVDDLEFPVD